MSIELKANDRRKILISERKLLSSSPTVGVSGCDVVCGVENLLCLSFIICVNMKR